MGAATRWSPSRLWARRSETRHDITKEGVKADITPVVGDLSDSEVGKCSVCRFLVPVCLFVWYVDMKLLTFLHWSLPFSDQLVIRWCFFNGTFSAWRYCFISAYWFIYERSHLFLRFLQLSEKYIFDYLDFETIYKTFYTMVPLLVLYLYCCVVGSTLPPTAAFNHFLTATLVEESCRKDSVQ